MNVTAWLRASGLSLNLSERYANLSLLLKWQNKALSRMPRLSRFGCTFTAVMFVRQQIPHRKSVISSVITFTLKKAFFSSKMLTVVQWHKTTFPWLKFNMCIIYTVESDKTAHRWVDGGWRLPRNHRGHRCQARCSWKAVTSSRRMTGDLCVGVRRGMRRRSAVGWGRGSWWSPNRLGSLSGTQDVTKGHESRSSNASGHRESCKKRCSLSLQSHNLRKSCKFDWKISTPIFSPLMTPLPLHSAGDSTGATR